MKVVKTSGEREDFSKHKLCRSLRAAGAPRALVDDVCRAVAKEIAPGASTSDIFRAALRHLVKKNTSVAARYGLKRGVAGLGPAGFLFEQFIEALMRAMGFTTERNKAIKGSCVSHEIDVLAKKGKEHFFIEAKYRNDPGTKTHIDTVMYADARLQDIARAKEREERGRNKHGMWLFTNTKFTTTAIRYATCRGLKLTGWSYPPKESLEQLVARYALYPVTVLPSVSRPAREIFARHNMMLAQDIAPYSPRDLVKKFGIEEKRAERIVREVHDLVYAA